MKKRDADREQLRSDVALMRELGVPLWSRPDVGEIRLGPPPQPASHERTPEEERASQARAERRRRDTLFAATSIRPVVPEEDTSQRAAQLKSAVPRRETPRHDGPPKQH